MWQQEMMANIVTVKNMRGEQKNSLRGRANCLMINNMYGLLWFWVLQQLIFIIMIIKHKTVENSSRDGNTRPPDLPLEKLVCRSGSNSY